MERWRVDHHSEKLLAIAAILTAVVTVATKAKSIWNGCRMTFEWIKDRINLPTKVLKQLDEQGRTIAEIRAELQPNGGTSLRDAINDVRTMAVQANARSYASREGCPYPMYECDVDGQCTWVNDALCHLFGMHPDAMHGYGWIGAIVESDREHARKLWEDAVKSSVPYSATYTIENQTTGRQIKCRTRAHAYRDGDSIVMYSGTVTEVKP